MRHVQSFLRDALSSCILKGVTTSYADVLARNMRAARARRGLEQEPVAARMRALGFSAWRRQTVAAVEKGARRLTAEEVLGLALALETRLFSLVEPSREDDPIGLPSGASMPFLTVHALIYGGSKYTVRWDGDIPQFPSDEPPDQYTAGFEDPLPPPRVRRGGFDNSTPSRRGDRPMPGEDT